MAHTALFPDLQARIIEARDRLDGLPCCEPLRAVPLSIRVQSSVTDRSSDLLNAALDAGRRIDRRTRATLAALSSLPTEDCVLCYFLAAYRTHDGLFNLSEAAKVITERDRGYCPGTNHPYYHPWHDAKKRRKARLIEQWERVGSLLQKILLDN